jgi:hypothetical protein
VRALITTIASDTARIAAGTSVIGSGASSSIAHRQKIVAVMPNTSRIPSTSAYSRCGRIIAATNTSTAITYGVQIGGNSTGYIGFPQTERIGKNMQITINADDGKVRNRWWRRRDSCGGGAPAGTQCDSVG